MSDSIKLKKFSIIYVILVVGLMFIFPNDYKYLIPYGRNILNIMVIILLILGYICYFPFLVKFIKKNILFLLPFIIDLISTIINNNNNNIEIAFQKIFCVFLFYFIAAFFKTYYEDFIKISENISFLILLFNIILMVFYKRPLRYSETAGRIYFIFEGSIGKLLIGNMLLFFTRDTLKISKYKVLHHIVYILSIYYNSSNVTSTVGIIIFYVYVLLIRKIKGFNVFLKFLLYMYVFIIIGLNFLIFSGYFVTILSNIFKKSITLSGRTIIWTNALNVIKEHLMIGIGEFSSDYFIILTHVHGATHAHNQILQILLNSGVIGLSVYIYYLFKLRIIKQYLKSGSPYIVYAGYLIVITFMCVTGNFFDNFFYLSFLSILNYIDEKDKIYT